MRRILIFISLISFLLLIIVPQTFAGTITISVENVGAVEISALQLFFDDAGQLPTETEINVLWAGSQSNQWMTYTALTTNNFVDGILAFDDFYNVSNKLVNGLVLTMTTASIWIGIDINNINNDIFDYKGYYGESIIAGLYINESWDGDHQSVTISGSAVPIPSTLFLLASGIVGFITVGRNTRS